MKKLKFNNKKKMPVHRLPFVGGKTKDGFGLSFWNVPDAGGYRGGNDTGEALAWIWLNHIQRNGSDVMANELARIVVDMADISGDARKGQAVGFLSVIERVMAGLIKEYEIKFLKEDRFLLEKANCGLAHRYEELEE